MSDAPRPPFVRFEVRSIEDRNASIAAGHYVGTDVIYALVTPAGSKDCVEKIATDWLQGIKEGVDQDRVPALWYQEYKAALKMFEESRETPEFGTPITQLAFLTPSQGKVCLDINVRTVEELADANEETLQRIGMGSRALKQQAQAWLDSLDQSATAKELEALRVTNAELVARDFEREKELADLKAAVAAITAEKVGA